MMESVSTGWLITASFSSPNWKSNEPATAENR